jgi:hypothetical protein
VIGGPSDAGIRSDTITMSVTCIDWFLSGGHQDHIHVELYLEDAFGDPVVGSTVRFETWDDLRRQWPGRVRNEYR